MQCFQFAKTAITELRRDSVAAAKLVRGEFSHGSIFQASVATLLKPAVAGVHFREEKCFKLLHKRKACYVECP